MTDKGAQEHGPSLGLLVGLSLGVGALLGLMLARRAARQGHAEIVESVEDLRERTQRVLNELSESVAMIRSQAPVSAADSGEAG